MTNFYPEGTLIDTPENRQSFTSAGALQQAMASGKILEGRAVVCDAQHNLIVDMGTFRGMIPRQEGALGVSEGKTRDIAIISRVNKPVCYKITELPQGDGGPIVPRLSRRAAQQQCMDEYIKNLQPGDVIDARVTHLDAFGCFVDIGCGLPSLVPIDSLSVSRISHPRDRFSPGQQIRVVVRAVAPDGRVTLTHKELLGTWEENAALFAPGETVAGVVRSVESYGIFVELTPNLAGLAEPREGIAVGQRASVYIKSLIPEKMKVKLVIIDAFDERVPAQPANYFFKGDHMDSWRYSPANADRIIETVFSPAVPASV